MVVHSVDGLDEISICDETIVAEVADGKVTAGRIAPEGMGLPRADSADLIVQDVAGSADVIRRVLAGEEGAARNMVLANGAAAIYVGGRAASLAEGVGVAAEAIDSGAAADALSKLVAVSNSNE
jgi:anthranilate phosphoribosyltransferase